MENFSENIRDQIPEGFQHEHYHYRQEEQEQEEEQLRNAVIKKQKGFYLKLEVFINEKERQMNYFIVQENHSCRWIQLEFVSISIEAI